jgi:hypothetical protein
VPFNKATAELSITVETKVAWLEGQLNEHYLHKDPDTSCRTLLANVVLAHLVGSDTGMATLVVQNIFNTTAKYNQYKLRHLTKHKKYIVQI